MIATGQCEAVDKTAPVAARFGGGSHRTVERPGQSLRGTRPRAKARSTNEAPRSARGNEREYGFVAAEAATTKCLDDARFYSGRLRASRDPSKPRAQRGPKIVERHE